MLQFWLLSNPRNIVISAIAQIEAQSAICRLRKEGRIAPDEAAIAFASIRAEVGRLIVQPIDSSVLDAASRLVDRHHLRALDAIQLSSAVIVRDLMSTLDMRFIASDYTLLRAAREEGFAIWDPSDDDSK